MIELDKDKDQLSVAAREILGKLPSSAVRWGNLAVIFLFIGALLFFSSLKHPNKFQVQYSLVCDSPSHCLSKPYETTDSFSKPTKQNSSEEGRIVVLNIQSQGELDLLKNEKVFLQFSNNFHERIGLLEGKVKYKFVPTNKKKVAYKIDIILPKKDGDTTLRTIKKNQKIMGTAILMAGESSIVDKIFTLF